MNQQQRRKQIIRLEQQGRTRTEIARELGVTYDTVRYALDPRRRDSEPDDDGTRHLSPLWPYRINYRWRAADRQDQ